MNKVLLKTYVEPGTKEDVAERAAGLNISISDYLRRVIEGAPLPQPGNAQAVRDLLKVNADLARLGNLLRLALDDDAWKANDDGRPVDVEELIASIRDRQSALKDRIKEL